MGSPASPTPRGTLQHPAFALGVLFASLTAIALALLEPTPLSLAFFVFSLLALSWIAWREVAKLRSVKRAYHMAMLAAHDGYWEWDPVSKSLKVGHRLLEILGYHEREIHDTHAWLELVHPEDRKAYNRAVATHLKGESPHFYCEYRVLAADGHYRWMASRGLAVRNRQGIAYQMVGSITDIDDRRRHQEEMEFLAQHDALTGLPNRLQFAEHLQNAIVSAREQGHRLAVLFIDLDRFKNINDTLGHRAGDQLLQSVALRLQAQLPDSCRLYRQGGDEFIVLASAVADALAAEQTAARIKEWVTQPYAGGEQEFFTSASIGISLFPDDAGDGETLLRHADTAMYEAKSAGGNAIRSHRPHMDQRVTFRMSLETRLRKALAEDRLELHFQPQFALDDGRLIGAEALLRWQEDDKAIPPEQFIAVAEESGLIIPIGEWVIARAVRQIATWRETHAEVPPIAINLSPRQFWRPGLAEQIVKALTDAALPSEALEVEVTESVLLDADGGSVDELKRLRAAGIAVALDDFGTGYSSLAYLQHLPVGTLKIDRSFINNLFHDDGSPGSEPMVRAIIAMAHSLGFRVIAEGVETLAQRQRLQALGCDIIQGYLIGRAQAPAEFARNFLVDRKTQG